MINNKINLHASLCIRSFTFILSNVSYFFYNSFKFVLKDILLLNKNRKKNWNKKDNIVSFLSCRKCRGIHLHKYMLHGSTVLTLLDLYMYFNYQTD